MANIFSAIHIAEEFEDTEIIYSVHMNPKVRATASEILGDSTRVHLIEPLQYQPLLISCQNPI